MPNVIKLRNDGFEENTKNVNVIKLRQFLNL